MINNFFISSYPNENNFNYLKKIRSLGITSIFTSLHIPEKNLSKKEVVDYLKKIKSIGFKEIVCDISKRTFNTIGLEELKKNGVWGIRIDFGLNEKEIIEIQNKKFKIFLNSSTIDEKEIVNLIDLGLDIKNTFMLHNFYLLPGTGLTKEFVSKQNRMFYKLGFKSIGGFIQGNEIKRSPIFRGLVTLEDLRDKDEITSFIESKNYFDFVVIGDVQGNIKEIERILSLKKKNQVKINLINKEFSYFLKREYTVRYDSGRDFFRLLESRMYATQGEDIKKSKLSNGEVGDVVIINSLGKRYSGEIIILKNKIKKNNSFNIIGKINPEDLLLIDSKIKFIF